MKKWIGWGTLIAMLVALWWFVLPPQLLGRTTMLTTHGISMEPYVHTGDLAILHKSSHYKVGDVIAYRSDTLNTTVMHRIISVDGNGITTKGDNNSWTDLDHPTNNQIYGRLDHLIKGGGKQLAIIRSVPVRILGASLCGLAIYYALRGNDEKVRKIARRKSTQLRDVAVERVNRPLPFRAIPYVLFCGLALSLGVTVLAFTKPTASSSAQQVIYNLHGTYGYSASTSDGGDLAYPDGQVSTGDTIYESLVKELFVTYGYRFDGLGKYHGTGTVELNAVLKGKTGWSHKVQLVAPAPFMGDSAHANAVIDLKKMNDLAVQIQNATKVKDGAYTISIQGVVVLHGTVAGQSIDQTFSSNMDLIGDSNVLKPQGSTASPATNSSPNNQPSTSSLKNSTDNKKSDAGIGIDTAKGGTVTIPPGAPAKLGIIGLKLGIFTLRMVSIALTLAFAAGLALVLWRRKDELMPSRSSNTIDGLDKDMVVTVTGVASASTQDTVVEVASLHDLAKIAERFEVLILQEENQGGTIFLVNQDTTTYRYTHSAKAANERFGHRSDAGSNISSEQ